MSRLFYQALISGALFYMLGCAVGEGPADLGADAQIDLDMRVVVPSELDMSTDSMVLPDAGACQPRNEACDGRDNDCDGQIDEDFDLQLDVNRCGGCDTICSLAHAQERCIAGECVVGSCEARFVDANNNAADGCECGLNIEACDGQDNDCDGEIDEDFSLQTDVNHCGACNVMCNVAAREVCMNGRCMVSNCPSGFADANGNQGDGCECAIRPEVCGDGIDNDCDGLTDEGFNLQTSAEHCGGCNMACDLQHAEERCVNGSCAVDACDAGFADANGQVGDGCECAIQGEVCDGADNDCDGAVDEDPDACGAESYCWEGACAPKPVITYDEPCGDFSVANLNPRFLTAITITGRPGAAWQVYNRQVSCADSVVWAAESGELDENGRDRVEIENGMAVDCVGNRLMGEWAKYVEVDGQRSETVTSVFFGSACPEVARCDIAEHFCPALGACNGPGCP